MKLSIAFLLLLSIAVEVNAQSLFIDTKTFTLTKACKVSKSIGGKDAIAVSIGKTFTALGENRSYGATHAYVEGSFGKRWIALDCGTYETVVKGGGTNAIPSDAVPAALPPGTLPFFDNIKNPVSGLAYGSPADVTPVAPVLNDFDRDVNATCGAPGNKVDYEGFRALMFKHPQILESTGLNIVQLSAIWFNAEGFNHIFCGEVVDGKLSGLHFAGRYLELQQKGLAGRLDGNLSKEEVIPGAVYTMGVKIKVGNSYLSAPIKGYPYSLNAEEILAIATKAYLANPNDGINKACNLPVTDDGKTFTTIFVTKYGGIRTFYPDATPDSNPACK
jgi:hypothetical protein